LPNKCGRPKPLPISNSKATRPHFGRFLRGKHRSTISLPPQNVQENDSLLPFFAFTASVVASSLSTSAANHPASSLNLTSTFLITTADAFVMLSISALPNAQVWQSLKSSGPLGKYHGPSSNEGISVDVKIHGDVIIGSFDGHQSICPGDIRIF